MKKISFLVGAGVGYVLGARAGHQRYEQIKSSAQGVWNRPKVQETVAHAQDLAAQKAPEVRQRIAETASGAAHKVTEKMTDKVGSGSDEQATDEGDGTAYSNPGTPAGFVENPAK